MGRIYAYIRNTLFVWGPIITQRDNFCNKPSIIINIITKFIKWTKLPYVLFGLLYYELLLYACIYIF